MNRYKLLIWAAIFWSPISFAANVYKTLHIVSGQLHTADSNTFSNKCFSLSDTFNQNQTTIFMKVGDSLFLKIVNLNSTNHRFMVKNNGVNPVSIKAGDSATVSYGFTSQGCWVFYDDTNFPVNYYQGLCGSIVVSDTASFVWNLREQQKAWNNQLDSGKTVAWNTYEPDYFFINNLNFPEVEKDTLSKIKGQLNQRFLIHILNTGMSAHSIHFHGYHGTIVFSTAGNAKVGWSKDTFPLEPMESLLLEFVPDKPGKFPVHDHNLVAVSGGGKYPNGMLVMMEILP